MRLRENQANVILKKTASAKVLPTAYSQVVLFTLPKVFGK